MGLLYVATYASSNGYKVRVLDKLGLTLEYIINLLNDSKPAVVGFYCDHENIVAVMSVIKRIKILFPQILIVVGGPQANEWDRRILLESPCDIAVRGEGEVTFYEILKWKEGKIQSLHNIEGITFRSGEEIIRNNERKVTVDLDSFPIPDRDLSINRTPDGVENLVTGRGCPYMCTFCYEGRSDSRYRNRSVDNVIEEIKILLQERRPYYIAILDDVFTLVPKRVMEFCEKLQNLRREYYDIKWFCEARADVIVKHPEMIKAAVKAGLIRIQIGVESGNQSILDAYAKNLKVEDIKEAIKICNENDVLSIIGNFIIGGAHETKETIQNSIKFAKELLEIGKGRMDINTTLYTPYPGTPLYHFPEYFGIEIVDKDCVTGPSDNYVFVQTKELSKWEILHQRQLFEEAVISKMSELIKDIPNSLLIRHFDAYINNGMRTKWFELMSRYFNLYNYFGLLFNGDYKHMSDIDPAELFELKPVRVIFLGGTQDGKFILDLKYKILKLDIVASKILELCYGRLTLFQICKIIHDQFYPLEEFRKVSEYVKNFMSQLDKDRLIVFSVV